ncbi:MAG TPA: Hpt domain-containing protein [Planctomycetota bacterium]|nr:Hpt domain-containing protein [Planctomycetota bacterium]
MSEQEPIDPGMLELFRGELEAHVPPLVQGLAAEKHPADQLQGMTRAAHSIKGAARIVGIEALADLAHEMESRLQDAVKSGAIPPGQMDALRAGAEFFEQLTQTPLDEMSHWLSVRADEVGELKARLSENKADPSPQPPPSRGGGDTAATPQAAVVSPPLEGGGRGRGSLASQPPVLAQEPLDPDMLDMFRMEVEGHAANLNDGLLGLEANPKDAEKLKSLMRAAHSIKGASRIVGIELGVKLAHAMEDCFVAAGDGTLELLPEHIDVMLRSVDMFVKLADCPPGTAERWLTDRSGEMVSLAAALDVLAKTGELHEEHVEAAEAAARSGAKMAAVGDVVAASRPHPASGSAGSNPTADGAGTAPRREVPPIEPLDESMLDLFRMEVEGHTAALNEGLLALEQSADVKPALQGLMRAAHSIKGASRIVGIEMGVKLAHAMEDWFVAAQNDKVALEPAQIDLLLRGVDLFSQLSIAAASAPQATEWLTQHYFDLDELAVQLNELVASGGKKPPAAAPASSASNVPAAPAGQSAASLPVTTMEAKTPATSTSMPTSGGTNTSVPTKPGAAKVVRVAAENLNRLLGLAGESLVETRWHARFAESLVHLKRQQMRLAASLRNLRRTVDATENASAVEGPLSDAERRATECSRLIIERLTEFERFTHRADMLSQRLYREAVGSRMRPFDDGVQGFPRLVRDLARQLGKRVQFLVEGRQTEVDRDVLERLEAPLNHLLRNALDHGLEGPDERTKTGKPPVGTLKIEARHRAGMLLISVSDDGRGVDLERVKARILERKLAAPEMVAKMTEAEILEFLFLPGFSTAKQVTDVSGRGVGLDVVQTMVQEAAGVVRITTKSGQGTSFHLQLPITLSVLRALLVEVQGEPYAFPLSRIERLLAFDASELKSLDNRQFVSVNGENIGIVSAAQVLDLGEEQPHRGSMFAVVVGDRTNKYALVVDRFIGESELVVRPLDARLGKVPAVSAASVLEDGTPCVILDIEDVVRLTDGVLSGDKLRKLGTGQEAAAKHRKRVLVVDDSFTVRETERKLLERHGYDVKTAVDGMEGWNAVRSAQFDLVISDVDMPRMNGIEFVRSIKQDERLRSIPVVIVSYKDREEDRMRGMDAGANYYLTKSSFQDDTFIRAVTDLIGASDDIVPQTLIMSRGRKP